MSIANDEFLRFVLGAIESSMIDARRVCFEITETAAIANLTKATHFISQLRERGCLFALDDFGSGLSSFAYLKTLPVDYLKIDGHFIRDIADDPVDESMVRAIHEVGNALGIETIAEHVETEAVLEKLAEIGIEYAQGFYIARPAPVSTFQPWGEDASSMMSA